MKLTSFFLLFLATLGEAQKCTPTLKCLPTKTPPTLDADLKDWSKVDGVKTTLTMQAADKNYDEKATIKCSYDSTNIYFAFEIPGDYRFNATNNKQCAAIATMMKVGPDATFIDMGGCPEALYGNCTNIPASVCDGHLVDIGAHWELAGTMQSVTYGINVTGGTGNDLTANKDDKYAVNSFCRKDDNGANAGNEWAGAWAHTNPIIGASGIYKFEMSRLLTTLSTRTDAQLVAGGTTQFGFAFWDPFEIEEKGWTDAGHYITGCANQWTDLVLVVPPTKAPTMKKAAKKKGKRN